MCNFLKAKHKGHIPSKYIQTLAKFQLNMNIGQPTMKMEWIAAASMQCSMDKNPLDGLYVQKMVCTGVCCKGKELGFFIYSLIGKSSVQQCGIAILLVHLERIGQN
jgi:hypothetical protein